MVMSAFRRSVKADTKYTGKKGGRGSFYERMKLPMNTPTPFIPILGDYSDPSPSQEEVEIDVQTGRPKEVRKAYKKFRKHRRKLNKNGQEWYPDEICSAGYNPHNPLPCTGCYAMDTGDKSVTLSDFAAFGIAHLAPYHGHPAIDYKTGQFLMKKDGSGPVISYDECEGRICNYCRVMRGEQPLPPQTANEKPFPNYDPRSLSTIFGHRRYMEVGRGHLGDLEGWDQVISSQCGNCQSNLITDGFACPNCNNLVIDMSNDPRTDEQIQDAVTRPYPCLTCNRPVLLREIVSCETCEAQGRTALQNNIFSVVLYGMRQGEGKNSHLMLSRYQSISEFERLNISGIPGVPLNQLLQGKTLLQRLEELAQPYDFDELLKPKSLQDQARRLELPIPPSAQGGHQQQQYSGYGNYAPTQGQPPFVPPQGGQVQPGQQWAPVQPVQPVQPQWQPQQPPQQYTPQPQGAPGPQPFTPPGRPNFGQ